jgi:hypothetical protein
MRRRDDAHAVARAGAGAAACACTAPRIAGFPSSRRGNSHMRDVAFAPCAAPMHPTSACAKRGAQRKGKRRLVPALFTRRFFQIVRRNRV